MTLACRYPNRVDGVISVDAAPVNERENEAFRSFTYSVLEFMHSLKDKNASITKEQAVAAAKDHFKGKPQFSSLIERNIKTQEGVLWIDQKHTELEWAINLQALRDQFSNVPYFDESLRYYGPSYNIVGGRSRIYELDQYTKVFPNQTQAEVVTVDDAGHWVHFDKPAETIALAAHFLEQIDLKN